MRNLLAILVVLLGSTNGCGTRGINNKSIESEISAVDLSEGGVAFVEHGERVGGISGGIARHVVVVDFAAKAKHYITNDQFLNSNPVLSPSLQHIAFLSPRRGKPSMLSLLGEGAPKQLYLLDLKTRVIRWADSVYMARRIGLNQSIQCVAWSKRAEVIYFSSGTNSIYALTPTGDSSWTVASFRESMEFVDRIIVSPDGRFLLCGYGSLSLQPKGIGIFLWDLEHSKRLEVMTGGKPLIPGGWFPGGKQILALLATSVDSAFWMINLPPEMHTNVLPVRLDSTFVSIDEAGVDRDGNLIVLAVHRPDNLKNKEVGGGIDVARVYLASGRVEWLTRDGSQKSELSVLP